MDNNEEVILTEEQKAAPEAAKAKPAPAKIGATRNGGFVHTAGQTSLPENAKPVEKLAEASAEGNEVVKTAEENIAAGLNADGTAKDVVNIVETDVNKLSDDQLRELYNKRFAGTPEKTEEEKAQEAAAREERMRALFLSKGGKSAEFEKIKEVASIENILDLSKQELALTLKAEGHDDDFINEILLERYYQLNPDELEFDEYGEETKEEFEARKEKTRKKVALGTKQLEGRGKKIKEDAAHILNTLKSAIEEQDAEAQAETAFTAKVDGLSTTLARKLTLGLGKLNDKDLGSVDVEASDSDIAEVQAILKDPAQRKQLLHNEDGSLNEKSIGEILLKNKMLEKVARQSLILGREQQVAMYEKIFPNRNPNAIGVGGAPALVNTEKGRAAKFGAPRRVGS